MPITVDFTPRLVPFGPERLVNSTTTGDQFQPVIASLPSGGFVACWVGVNGLAKSIRAQMFDGSGNPIGGEIFFVGASELFHEPCIAALPAGGFVICWTGPVGGVFGQDIYLQRFDASGATVGTPAMVNANLAPNQFQPSITSLPSGGFVVTWTEGAPGTLSVKAQLFDSLAAKVGGELLIGATPEADQNLSSVTALASGGFVVSWRETAGIRVGGGGGFTFVGGDGSGSAVVAQVYDAAGVKVGSEFLVNTTTTGDQTLARIAALAGGGFVATWQDASGAGGDASTSAIKGQIFSASGAKIGGEFLVNSATLNGQTDPSVTALPSGGFMISWTDASGQGGDASGTGIKAQTFNASGIKVGGEFLVNGATLNAQADPSLVALASGEVAIIWTDNSGQGGDAAGSGIKTQLLNVSQAIEQTAFSLKGVIRVVDDAIGAGSLTVTLAVDHGRLDVTAGTSGAFVSGSGTDTFTLTGTLGQIQALLGSDPASLVTFTADSDDPPASAELSVAADDGHTSVASALTIAIIPINDAPEGADATIIVSEDGIHTFTAADFGFSDVDGNALTGIQMTTLPVAGSLRLDGIAVTVGTVVSAANIVEGKLTFAPIAEVSGNSYASFTFRVKDDGGTANGGIDTDPTPNTITINVTSVDDAPVHHLPASLSTIEGAFIAFAGSVVIDPAPTVVSDPDSLFITTHLSVADGSLASWNHGGAMVTGEGTNEVTLSGTVAQVNQALYTMAYTPAVGVSGSRAIIVTTDDGDLSDIDTISVTIADIGIEPVGQDVSRGTREDVRLQLSAADFPFSDSEGQDLAGILVSTLPTRGRIVNTVGWAEDIDLNGDGVPDVFVRRFEYREGEEISRADLDAGIVFYVPDAGTSGPDAFTFQVRDTGGPDFGENLDQSPNSFSILVEAVNDLPVTVANPSSEPEDFPLVTVMLQASDREDGGTRAPTFRIDSLPAHGVLTNAGLPVGVGDEIPADYYHSVSGNWLLLLSFEPDANWSGSTGFDYVAIDSEGGESLAATATIDIAPVADAPIVDANVNDGAEPVGLALNVTASNSAEDSPSVTTLDHGRTLVVWQRGLASSNIVAQPFAADGTPERQPFSVTNIGGPSETHPVVAGKPDGSFAIAWVQQGIATGGGDIPVAFYNPGTTSPTLFVVAIGSEDAIESAPSIAALPDGWVIVARTDAGGGAIRIQPYAADLSAGAPLTILDGAGAATVTPLGDSGDYVVIGTFPDGSIQQVLVSGGIAGAPVDVFDGPGGSNAEVTRLADGGYVVVWSHDDGTGNKALYGRLYDTTGAASTDVVVLTDPSFPSEFDADVAALPDGRFVVAWVGTNGVGPSQDIFAQLFAFDGSPIGAPIPVTATGLGPTFPNLPIAEIQPTITVLEDGRFTVGWLQTPATGGNNPDIFLRTYVASAAEVSGISGEPIILPTTVALADADGSEMLASVRLAFLPAGFTLPVGERVGTDWVIDRSSAAEADFLDALADGNAALTVTAPYGFSGFLNLPIVATSRETGDPSETATSVGVVPILVTDPLRLDLNGPDVGADANADFTEDGGAILVAPAALALGGTDMDLDGATLALALTANAEAADLVEIIGNGPGQIDVTGSDVRFGGIVIGTLAGGAGTLTVTFNANADAVSLQALLQRIAFSNSSDNPSDLARTLSVTLVDGSNGLVSAATAEIHVEPVDDAANAQPDGYGIDENGTIAGASLFANDGDPDGPPLEVAQVNGAAANVGTQIMLASGALLTVNADGTYDYDPNGAFNYLITAANGLATGAVNSSAADSFTYTLAGGGTANVTITIDGVDSPDDELRGDAADNAIGDTVGIHVFNLSQGGNDTASGLGGDDAFWFGGAFTALDSVDGGAGFDTLSLEGDYATTRLVLAATSLVNVEAIIVSGGFSCDIVSHDGNVAAGETLLVDGSDLDRLEALLFDGSAESDGRFILIGGSGDDLLTGGGRDDRLFGGGGDNVLDGGNGNGDVVDYRLAPDALVIDLSIGMASDNGFGDSDLLFNIENVIGTDHDDSLTGDGEINVLDGGLGADFMAGGDGSDSYVVDNPGDQVIETVTAGGTDIVRSSVSFTLGANVDNLDLTGLGNIDATGNDDANTLTGNAGNNVLNGGLGADFLRGGLGDDTYVVDNSGDAINEFLGQGTDTVQSSLTYTLGLGLENLILTGAAAINGTGNIFANILIGNANANVLDGKAGADTMNGGLGNDTYIVDNVLDTVAETSAGGGTDEVRSSATFTLGSNIENLVLTGVNAISGTGNNLANSLIGNNAANILDGGFGADTMQGGAGNDTYIIDNVGDVVTELAGGGTDTVQTSLNHTLGAEFERLVLTGTGNLNGTGNSLANILTGNSGANQLDGAGGGDIMQGGLGNDSYFVDNGLDIVVEAAGGGTDTVNASLSHDLESEVENLVLTGVAAINGTGNSLANTLTGNGGANRLDGRAGADVMNGGQGDDIYIVDQAGDVVSELAGQGTDRVESAVSYTLAAAVENLSLTGSGDINGTGNLFANVLTGNDGANRLDGNGGADTMNGGLGNDTYVVDNAGDTVIESSPTGGTDTVESSISFVLGPTLENLTLTGANPINGTGNAVGNVLIGNSFANSLSGLGGDDQIDGGLGNDRLAGGSGHDAFVFDTALNPTANVDAITDLAAGVDKLLLDDSVFTGLATGTLDAAAFRAGTAALDADDRILYDNATGRLFYDSDGAGGDAAILFATVAPGTGLTSLEFVVF